MTCNSEVGPVASYTAPGFNSCSFFSNLSIDPTDRYLLSGSSLGQAFIWDTSRDSNESAFELPVSAQLEVSKTAWAADRKGSLDSQIACISDDLTFSLFNWKLEEEDEQSESFKRPKELTEPGREVIYREDPLIDENETLDSNMQSVIKINSNSSSHLASIPGTPVRKKPQPAIFVSTPPPNSANKSILDFFTRSPRVEPNSEH